MASTKTPAKKGDVKFDDLRDVKYSADGSEFTAHVLDEPDPFLFSTDVNAFVLAGAFTGGVESIGAMRKIIQSVVLVPDADDLTGDDLEGARMQELDRFNDAMSRQRGMTMERLATFLADIIGAAGNGTPESSSD